MHYHNGSSPTYKIRLQLCNAHVTIGVHHCISEGLLYILLCDGLIFLLRLITLLRDGLLNVDFTQDVPLLDAHHVL